MAPKSVSSQNKLNNVIDYLAKVVVEELNEDAAAWFSSIEPPADMRELVRVQLLKNATGTAIATANATVAKPLKRGLGRKALSSRLRTLRSLLASQPDLAPSLSAAFAAGRTPSDVEVEGVVNELLKRGLLDD